MMNLTGLAADESTYLPARTNLRMLNHWRRLSSFVIQSAGLKLHGSVA
jgi:hypothetical protein